MNEFIAWDKEKKIFVPQGEIVFSFYEDTRVIVTPNCMEYIGDTCHDNYNENRFIIFKDIGLKDINGKSIYADSSIVEFEHKDKKLQGFFRYSKMRLSYVIEDLYNDMGEMVYDGSQNNFKIIDTMQEAELWKL